MNITHILPSTHIVGDIKQKRLDCNRPKILHIFLSYHFLSDIVRFIFFSIHSFSEDDAGTAGNRVTEYSGLLCTYTLSTGFTAFHACTRPC